MTEINKITFWRSFRDAKNKMKDPAERLAFYDAIVDYAFDGIEPRELPPLADMAFTVAKPNIDSGIKDCENGKKGGAPKENKNAKKQPPLNPENNPPCFFETTPETSNLKEKEEIEYEKEEEGEDEAPAEAGFPPPLSPPRENYARKVFDIWRKAGLPCRNGNFITFLQTDFKTALVYTEGIHSDSVIKAAENYASVMASKDTDPFWKRQQVSFEAFCRGRLMPQFLPENFRAERYRREMSPGEAARLEADERREKRAAREAEEYAGAPDKCPNCGGAVRPHKGLAATVLCAGCGLWWERRDGNWERVEFEGKTFDLGKIRGG